MSLTALVYLALFGLSSIAAILYAPVYGIYFYLLNLFLFPPNKWWYSDIPDLRYIFLNSLIILLAYIVHHQNYKYINVFNFAPTKWFLVLIILSFAILPVAIVPDNHQHYAILLLKYFVLYYILIKTINTHKYLNNLLLVLIICCFYWGFLYFEDPSRTAGRLEDIGGPGFSQANEAAAVVLTSIPIMVFFLIKGNKYQKIITFCSMPFILNVFILFNSRGAFLALLGMGMYLICQLLIKSKYFDVNKVYIIISCIFLIFAFIYLTDDTFINRMHTISDPSQHGRIDIWKGAWQCALDNPIGLGRRGFAYLSPQYLDTHLLASQTGMRAEHNIIFETLTSMGFLGLVIFLMFIFSILKTNSHSKKNYIVEKQPEYVLRTIALESSLLGFLIASLFINNLYAEFLYLFAAFIVINRQLSFQYNT